jgi:hypothetical protein
MDLSLSTILRRYFPLYLSDANLPWRRRHTKKLPRRNQNKSRKKEKLSLKSAEKNYFSLVESVKEALFGTNLCLCLKPQVPESVSDLNPIRERGK